MSTHVTWLACPADYGQTWEAMRAFTAARTSDTHDEIWLCEHAPVYTLGQAGKPEHVLDLGRIPLVQTDRGGQVTYHGPGQIIAYALIDLRRAGLFVKEYVHLLEEAAIATLAAFGVPDACRVGGAPGVYVPTGDTAHAKIAALGVKIRNGYSYHGIALNVSMDLQPYAGINPCGMAGLETIDMAGCARSLNPLTTPMTPSSTSDTTPTLACVGEMLASQIVALVARSASRR